MRSADKCAARAVAAAGMILLLAAVGIFSGKVDAAREARPEATPNYTIRAVRYATVRDFPLNGLVMGAPEGQKIDIAMVFWVIQGGGHTVLFDSGFHRGDWAKEFGVTDYLAPDKAIEEAGATAAQVTDIIVSHAHWDHMGGVDLFPNATVWIQKGEYEYYSGAAWQPGGQHGGIDPDDVVVLVRRNEIGKLRFVNGDDQEILPGIRAYTGARHTYASQYIRVAGEPAYVLASDNCYTYENLKSHRPGATFDPADQPGNVAAQKRMVELAGSEDRVVPGHDPEQLKKFPTTGRVATIK